MDRISNLPKPILHNILSRLPEEDAARTSVLSKTWKDTWSTFPILVFKVKNFGISRNSMAVANFQQMEDHRRKVRNFFDSVDRALLNFHTQRLAIKEFRLNMNMGFYDHEFSSPCLDHWMEMFIESGVEVLELSIGSQSLLDNHYCLSPSLLEARSLNKLILSGCFRVDQAFLNHPIKFSSLKVLTLYSVYLGDEQAIQNLISSCPLIEYITLSACSSSTCTKGFFNKGRLKSVTIHGLCKLKGVEFIAAQEVVVDAPSLEDFCFIPSIANIDAPSKANVDRCRNLKKLELSSVNSSIINDQWLIELFSKFPLLSSLKLAECPMSEMIKFSSVQLKFLYLRCSNMKEINIDAPNLYSFRYCDVGGAMPMISFVNCSSQLKADVQLRIQSYLGFPKLREFLQNFKSLSIHASLVLVIHPLTGVFNRDILQEIPAPPPSIKRLDLFILTEYETMCLPLVTCLLWSCCPSIISLGMRVPCCRILVKVLCEKLLVGREEECCCSSSTIKCWWHGLKDVEIKSSSWKDNVVDSRTFLDSLPNLPLYERVSLRLKW